MRTKRRIVVGPLVDAALMDEPPGPAHRFPVGDRPMVAIAYGYPSGEMWEASEREEWCSAVGATVVTGRALLQPS